jgi:Domain of unknown function (DUF2017)
MRLSLQKNAGQWRLGEMQKIHLDFLKLAADDASMSDCPGGRERLFPKPLSGKDEWIDDEFNEEWKEMMAPELEMQFAGDVGIFLADLDSVQSDKGKGGVAASIYRLDVPAAHGQAWFSTLNQARLLLDLKYKLHDPRDAPGETAAPESFATSDDPARIFVLMRYEFYAWIQEWLVRNVL